MPTGFSNYHDKKDVSQTHNALCLPVTFVLTSVNHPVSISLRAGLPPPSVSLREAFLEVPFRGQRWRIGP